MEESIYYVYQYATEEGLPYYIGKGKNGRATAKHIVTVLPKERIQVLVEGLTHQAALDYENKLIWKHKRKVDGGILDNIKMNRWVCQPGRKHGLEAKNKISQGKTGGTRSEARRQSHKSRKIKGNI